MRHLLIVVLAIIFSVAMHFMKQHREKIMVGAVIMFSLICGAYSLTHAEGVLNTRGALLQTFYSPDYIETSEFPDAFLRLYVDGKTIYTKNDKIDYEQAEEKGIYWQYVMFHQSNICKYLEVNGTNVISDEAYNEYTVDGDKRDDFESLGYINDMLRNVVLYSICDAEAGNFFYYLFYYRDMAETSTFYVNAESLKDADELVLIWQQKDGGRPYTEDMYLMSKEYFDNNLK